MLENVGKNKKVKIERQKCTKRRTISLKCHFELH